MNGKKLKKSNSLLAENELNIFSDIVREDVLSKTQYLEHFSRNIINLFKYDEREIDRIVIKIKKEIDLLIQNDYNWLLKNYNRSEVELFEERKSYTS